MEDPDNRDVREDLHALRPDAFYSRVHSFQHWFDSVQGYLDELEQGHRADIVPEELPENRRERLITVLCNYSVGETAALEASSGLVRIAPNRPVKIFLATQVVDEARHTEVFIQRLQELGVADPEAAIEARASAAVREFKRRLLELVDGADWDAAILAQNVILEAMELSVFEAHAAVADPVTVDVLSRVLKDERRHIGFGENELGRRLKRDAVLRQRLSRLKRELDHLVLQTVQDTLEALGLSRDERPDIGRNYLAAVERLGLQA
ncbi:MAG: ferritin-like domain-containing protein [Myxococcales bacterium]|nr:ferritin-like domain-containing protein [Myxococcales bacterium]